MLKIYIYWHKCYFGHGDNNNNRVNLEQVCSLNIEQSRLLQKYQCVLGKQISSTLDTTCYDIGLSQKCDETNYWH